MDHPNVLNFIGLCRLDNRRFAFVSPFMKNGNLLAYVEKHESANRTSLVRCLLQLLLVLSRF